MHNFLAGVIAWMMLCACGFLLASLVGSFVALEWGFVGQGPLSRAFLAVLFIWLAVIVYKVGGDDA